MFNPAAADQSTKRRTSCQEVADTKQFCFWNFRSRPPGIAAVAVAQERCPTRMSRQWQQWLPTEVPFRRNRQGENIETEDNRRGVIFARQTRSEIVAKKYKTENVKGEDGRDSRSSQQLESKKATVAVMSYCFVCSRMRCSKCITQEMDFETILNTQSDQYFCASVRKHILRIQKQEL